MCAEWGTELCINCGGAILDIKAKERDDFMGMCRTCMNKIQKGDDKFVSIPDRIKYRKQRTGKIKRFTIKIPSLKRG